MNYLELCNALHEKTGESGSDLVAVTGLSGYQKKIANQIKNAWTEIQTLHTEWRFMRQEALPTVAAAGEIVDADAWVVANMSLSIEGYFKDTFSIYLTATGISDETKLIYVPFERWKQYHGLQYGDGVQDRPSRFTIIPSDDTLKIGAVSDGAYTIAFEFRQSPIVLAANSDTPNIHSSLHDVIVWRALEMYGYREQSKFDIDEGKKNYLRLLRRLENRELPEVTIGEPLA